MRLAPRDWHTETWVCSMRGHVTPAASVATLRPEDRRVGVTVDEHHRLCRCLRCDAWLEVEPPPPGSASADHLPPLAELPHPRRGRDLDEAVVVRLIAIERAVHAVIFGLLALALAALDLKLPALRASARGVERRLTGPASQTGPGASRDRIGQLLHRVTGLRRGEVTVLLVTATIYCVVEGTEAVGLWRERRWAEYLTVVATAGFLPFEVHELIIRLTAFRVGALVVNLAVLAYLVWAKHLFGIRGGAASLGSTTDWDDVLEGSAPARHR